MDQDRRKKRTRDQEEDNMNHFSEKKKQASIRQEQGYCTNDDITSSGSSTSDGSPGQDAEQGVFDFPWLKDGVVSKSDEWRFEEEDVFMSQQLGGVGEISNTTTTITTPAGIEFSFPGQCLCQTPVEAVLDFPGEKFDEENECPLLEDDAFGTADGFDIIWGALLN